MCLCLYIYVLYGCLGSVEDIQREIWPKCASVQLALNRFHTLFHPRRVRLQYAIALDSTREQRKPKAECIWRAIGIGVNCIRRTQCLDWVNCYNLNFIAYNFYVFISNLLLLCNEWARQPFRIESAFCNFNKIIRMEWNWIKLNGIGRSSNTWLLPAIRIFQINATRLEWAWEWCSCGTYILLSSDAK